MSGHGKRLSREKKKETFTTAIRRVLDGHNLQYQASSTLFNFKIQLIE